MFASLALIGGICMVAAGGGVELWADVSLALVGWAVLACGLVFVIGLVRPTVSIDRAVDSMVMLSSAARAVLGLGSLTCGALLLIAVGGVVVDDMGLLPEGATVLGVVSMVVGFWVVIPMMFPFPFPAVPGTERVARVSRAPCGSGSSPSRAGNAAGGAAAGATGAAGSSAGVAGGSVAATSSGALGALVAVALVGVALAGSGVALQMGVNQARRGTPPVVRNDDSIHIQRKASRESERSERSDTADYDWGFGGGGGGGAAAPAPGTIVLFAGPAALAMRRRRSAG
jgi:hypothetical protein